MGPSKKIDIRVPQLTKRDISLRVEKLLEDAGCTGACPVDVEGVVEKHLKISILPINGLKSLHGIDAYISGGSQIVVDEGQYNSGSVRYRFSLAHELAHYVLHYETYEKLGIDSIESHVAVQNKIPDDALKTIEIQAYRFAGCLLLPDSAFSPIINKIFSEKNLQGMTISEAYGAVDQIAQDFNVSKDVVQRQLIYFYPDIYRGLGKLLSM